MIITGQEESDRMKPKDFTLSQEQTLILRELYLKKLNKKELAEAIQLRVSKDYTKSKFTKDIKFLLDKGLIYKLLFFKNCFIHYYITDFKL